MSGPIENAPLIPLPKQSAGTPWPTVEWPERSLGDGSDLDVAAIAAEADRLFAADAADRSGETHALVVVHRGALVLERYDDERDRETTLISWSMAKSILHAVVGMLVGQGRIDVEAAAGVPRWQQPGDPRRAITLDHLLRMTDGLDFVEDYIDDERSSVIEMLFGGGKDDVAAYAEAVAAAHPPGANWNYSSGTSNIVAGIVGRVIGGGAAGVGAFLSASLFEPLGMRSAKPRFDEAGTFIASSFVFATARDFARFGLLYLRDGVWEGRRLLPEGWVDQARTLTPASAGQYGAHFWLAMNGSGVFHCSGFQGQYIAMDPARDLVIVRLGKSETSQRGAVYRSLDRIRRAFPVSADD